VGGLQPARAWLRTATSSSIDKKGSLAKKKERHRVGLHNVQRGLARRVAR
jgi:hypothetical protein